MADRVSTYYGQSPTIVNTLSIIFQGLFVLFTFPSTYVIDIYGSRTGVFIGTFLNTLGMGIKILINKGFWISIVGQILCGIAQPFLVNAPAKMAATWFAASERLTALTLCVTAVIIGAAIGFIFPVFFITDEDEGETFKHNVMMSLIAQAIIGAVITILTFIFFKSKPKSPPSSSAFDRIDEAGIFTRSIKETFTNKDFMFLFLTFLMVLGAFNTLATIVAYLCQVWDYSDTEASLFGGMFIFGGILGSVLFGIFVEKT